MFRLHCNKCYSLKRHHPSLNFYISCCKHILCHGCLPESPRDKKCPLCGTSYKPNPINSSMPDKVAWYFEDPKHFLELYRKISKFQEEQRASDDRGYLLKLRRNTQMQRQMDTFDGMEEQVHQYKKHQKHRPHLDESLSSEDIEVVKPKKRRFSLPPTPSTSSSEDRLSDKHNASFLQHFEATLTQDVEKHKSSGQEISYGNVLDFNNF